MSQITLSNGKSFAAAHGATILDAGLRAGVSLAYSCRTGRCGTCRGRVDAGETRALHDETGLTAAEREDGWILTCVRTPTTDVTIEADDLGAVPLAAARTLACRIQALDALAPDVLRVTLRLPPTATLDYRPGQYIDVIGHGGLRRSYSIANAPAADRRLELHVGRVDGGAMSDYWFGAARVDDLLRLHGPLGTFFLREPDDVDLVFLATGTGIAPVKAILEDLGRRPDAGQPRSVRVYFGGRRPADLYWTPDAGTARFVPVLSRADAAWGGARGHVQDALLADMPDLAQAAVYACGSDAMIHDAHAATARAGLPANRFLSDAFVCSADA